MSRKIEDATTAGKTDGVSAPSGTGDSAASTQEKRNMLVLAAAYGNGLSPLEKSHLAEIEKRQVILEKWIADYDSCTYEEDSIASRAFDDVVADIAWLLKLLRRKATNGRSQNRPNKSPKT